MWFIGMAAAALCVVGLVSDPAEARGRGRSIGAPGQATRVVVVPISTSPRETQDAAAPSTRNTRERSAAGDINRRILQSPWRWCSGQLCLRSTRERGPGQEADAQCPAACAGIQARTSVQRQDGRNCAGLCQRRACAPSLPPCRRCVPGACSRGARILQGEALQLKATRRPILLS